jgi:hypothetical protein
MDNVQKVNNCKSGVRIILSHTVILLLPYAVQRHYKMIQEYFYPLFNGYETCSHSRGRNTHCVQEQSGEESIFKPGEEVTGREN